jgi:hypothetical protein
MVVNSAFLQNYHVQYSELYNARTHTIAASTRFGIWLLDISYGTTLHDLWPRRFDAFAFQRRAAINAMWWLMKEEVMEVVDVASLLETTAIANYHTEMTRNT